LQKSFFKKRINQEFNFFFHCSSYSKNHKTGFTLLKHSKVSSIHLGKNGTYSSSFPSSPKVKGPQCEGYSFGAKELCLLTPVYSRTREIAKKKEEEARSSYQTPCLHQQFWLDQLLSDSN
jgi:hypothetical protein